MLKNKHYTIQIIPSGTENRKTIVISHASVRIIVYSLILLSAAVLVFIIKFSEIQMKALSAENLKRKNRALTEKQIKLDSLEADLIKITNKAKTIENILQVFIHPDSSPVLFSEKQPEKPLFSIEDRSAYVKTIDSIQKAGGALPTIPEQYIPSLWPVKGILGNTFDSDHRGIDIIAAMNTIVSSPADGIVSESGWKRDLGNTISVNHGGHYTTVYGHLNNISVKLGDYVPRGAPVGTVGSSGNSTGPHLHYEVYFRRTVVDPLKFIRK